MQNKNIILWEGPSAIDGKPIAAIMTGVKSPSRNAKTGSLLQVWIMRSDIHPMEALRASGDYSVCGNCKFRGDGTGKKRTCYVNMAAVGQIWTSYKAGKYQHWNSRKFDSRKFAALCLLREGIRWGAYGDPAMLPFDVFSEISSFSSTNLGYTHQWQFHDFAKPYQGFLQASCDYPGETAIAKAAGWKTFTVLPENYSEDDYLLCAGGKTTTCATCRLCDGNKADVAVQVHGATKKYYGQSLATV